MAKKKTTPKKISKKKAAKASQASKASKKKMGVKKASPKKASPKKTSKKPAVKAARGTAKKGAHPVVESLLKVGDRAPSFRLLNEAGESVSLAQFQGKTVVLYFYPKDDTPGCTQESCDFRDSFSRLVSKGVVVLGASKDSVASHQKFKTKYQLPFSLLSDESGSLCEAYGVWKEKSMYGRKYMGIERSTFIINPQGRIARVYPKVSVSGHVDQVLADVEQGLADVEQGLADAPHGDSR